MLIKRREAVPDPVDPAHMHWSPRGCIILFPFNPKNYNYRGQFKVTYIIKSIIKSLAAISCLSLCSVPLAFGVPVCSNTAILLLILIQNYLYRILMFGAKGYAQHSILCSINSQ